MAPRYEDWTSIASNSLVEKWQYDKGFGIKPVLGAHVLRQSEIPLGLGHVAPIKVQRRKAIIARKKQLRLGRFLGQLECLVIAAGGEFPLAMALVNLPEHDQRHGKMLAQIERAVEFNRLFGRRHALLGTPVREGAAGDCEVG